MTPAKTAEDTQSAAGLVIARNTVDGAEVTHFKITGITGGSLYQNDGTTAIHDGDFITAAQGGAGLRFTPAAETNSLAGDRFGFTVQAALDASGTGLSPTGTAAGITVSPVADAPAVTTATSEETQTASGLVIARSAADGDEVTHFKITAITGGALYQNDGATPIGDGDFITVAQGAAGLRFTPAPDKNTPAGDTFSFTAQAALDASGTGLSPTGTATIVTVTEVNDPPAGTDDSLPNVAEDSGTRTIPFADLLANDSKGPADESGQTLTILSVTGAAGGTVSISGTTVRFTPGADYGGPASFTYTLRDDGTTAGVADPKSATAKVTFNVTPVNDPPTARNLTLSATAGIAAEGTLSATDTEGNALRYSIVSGPIRGTAAVTNAAAGTFTYTATGENSGTDSLTYVANDGFTNSNPATVTITVGAALPLTISAQADVTREAAVTVSGTTAPNQQVQVGSTSARADSAGNWSATVPLQEGPNVITASVGIVTRSVTVTRDSTPPSIHLTASEPKTEASEVTLTATSEQGAAIKIEGTEATSVTVHLFPGLNTFSAAATDRAGNTATASVTVERTVPEEQPAETVIEPDQSSEVATSYVTVQVPAQTASERLRLIVTEPESSQEIRQAQQAAVIAVAAEVHAETTVTGTPVHQLNKYVTLTFTYDPTLVSDPLQLKVYYFDPVSQVWVELGGTVNTTAHTISIQVDHFTLFAVMAPQGPAPEVASLPGTVSQSSLAVTGKGKPGISVTLMVNGTAQSTAAVGDSGQFSLNAALAEGKNRLYVIGSGTLASREVTVTYQPAETPPEELPPTFSLTDVTGHWAAATIAQMVRLGVVKGYEDGTFRPENRVSRLEFAVMTARLLKLSPVDDPLPFADAARIPDWARGQVAAAVKAGIITGRADGTFDPGAPVTRAEVAIMLTRVLKAAGQEAGPGSAAFTDAGTIPAWASDGVLTAARFGLVTGYADGTFRAGNTATRAEAVTMLARLLNLLSR